MKYPQLVQQHFFNPYHSGEWPAINDDVACGKGGSYSLGAVVQLQWQCQGSHITEARFKAYGNPYLIAAASYTTQWLEGKSISAVAQLTYQWLIDELDLPTTQQHCAIVIEESVKAALNDCREANE